jgi:hypothetical protein
LSFDTTVYIIIELSKSVWNIPFHSRENSLKEEIEEVGNGREGERE